MTIKMRKYPICKFCGRPTRIMLVTEDGIFSEMLGKRIKVSFLQCSECGTIRHTIEEFLSEEDIEEWFGEE